MNKVTYEEVISAGSRAYRTHQLHDNVLSWLIGVCFAVTLCGFFDGDDLENAQIATMIVGNMALLFTGLAHVRAYRRYNKLVEQYARQKDPE